MIMLKSFVVEVKLSSFVSLPTLLMAMIQKKFRNFPVRSSARPALPDPEEEEDEGFEPDNDSESDAEDNDYEDDYIEEGKVARNLRTTYLIR